MASARGAGPLSPHASPLQPGAPAAPQRAASSGAILPGDLSPMGARKVARQASAGSSSSSSRAKGAESPPPPALASTASAPAAGPSPRGHTQPVATATTSGDGASQGMQVLDAGAGATAASAASCSQREGTSGLLVLGAGKVPAVVATGAAPACPPQQQQQQQQRNRMDVLEPEQQGFAEADAEELDLVKVLRAGTIAEAGTQQAQQAARVLRSTAVAAAPGPVTAVLAAGVGWGLGPRGLGTTTTADPGPCSQGIDGAGGQAGGAGQDGLCAGWEQPQASSSAARAPSSVGSRPTSVRPVGNGARSVAAGSSHHTGHSAASRSTARGGVAGAAGRTSAPGSKGAGGDAQRKEPDMVVQQQIWRMRRAFGLEATPLKDPTAAVQEFGAGAWS